MTFHRFGEFRIFQTRRGYVGVAAMTAALGLLSACGDRSKAEPQTSRFEIDFMKQMSDHHAAAVAMARVGTERAVHPELREMCKMTVQMQGSEIEGASGFRVGNRIEQTAS